MNTPIPDSSSSETGTHLRFGLSFQMGRPVAQRYFKGVIDSDALTEEEAAIVFAALDALQDLAADGRISFTFGVRRERRASGRRPVIQPQQAELIAAMGTENWWTAAALVAKTGLKPGSVRAQLAMLEGRGLVERSWRRNEGWLPGPGARKMLTAYRALKAKGPA